MWTALWASGARRSLEHKAKENSVPSFLSVVKPEFSNPNFPFFFSPPLSLSNGRLRPSSGRRYGRETTQPLWINALKFQKFHTVIGNYFVIKAIEFFKIIGI